MRAATGGPSATYCRGARVWRVEPPAARTASASSPPMSIRWSSSSPPPAPSRTRGCSTDFSSSPNEAAGFVVDTPGLREVGMWALSAEHLDAYFPELRPFVPQCRFTDCTHTVEPGCAVKEAVARGDVSGERFASYLKLRDELEETDFQ